MADEMTVDEAATLLGIDRSVVARAVQRGRIGARRVGQRLLLLKGDDVRAYAVTRKERPRRADAPPVRPP